MAKAVSDVGYKLQGVTLRVAQDAVYGLDHNLDKVDVLPLVETTNVVGLSNLALVEDEVDSTCVVLDIEPVADVLALAIYGQWLTVAYVVDKEWYQLLGELVWTIVIRAVRYNCRHAIGVVVGTHKVIARGL